MAISDKVKAARMLLGLSQADAAMGSGIAQKDISLMENGKKRFVADEYILFLYNSGVDLNSLYNEGMDVRLAAKRYENTPASGLHLNEPEVPYITKISSLKPGYKTKNDPETGSAAASVVQTGRQNPAYLTPQFITVDNRGNENILHVSVKAAAGYLAGHADPDYLGKLPSFNLPGLTDATYRSFEVDGDSMYPTLKNGQMVIGEWVEKLEYIREDRVYIVVTRHDRPVIKRLLNRIETRNLIIAKSDATNNRELYKNIEIKPDDIVELWYARFHGGFDFQSPADMWKRVNNHEADITILQNKIDRLMDILKNAGLLK